jgi:hypothetical protein
MKKVGLIITGLMLTIISSANGKERSYNVANYGLNMSQALSGSGFGSTLNASLNVQVNNRLFELGYLMDSKTNQFRGLEFQYKHFIGFYKHQKNGGQYNKTLRPYLFYNFIYHSPVDVQGSLTLNGSSPITIPTQGKLTSFEHSLGIGVQVKLVGSLYMENSLGFGTYLGSKYQGSEKPSTIGIHKNNYGFVPSFHVGFGYQF